VPPKFIKQTLLTIMEQLSPDTIIVRDLNTPPSSIEHPEKNINKDILELNNT
jgi:hypothetical protein